MMVEMVVMTRMVEMTHKGMHSSVALVLLCAAVSVISVCEEVNV